MPPLVDKNKNKKANRLIDEKSPYLLQHAYNPVEWFPWGKEAFDRARENNLPVFLSIGYSTCHWCHVMEKESFEDQEVAGLLNRLFVPVKVDREERPDLDQFYMSACQAMTGHGGWPLTVILTPEGKPFFAGTYFPKNAARGMPGLLDILTGVYDLWQQDRNRAVNAGEELYTLIQKRGKTAPAGKGELPGEELLEKAFGYFKSHYDQRNAGFNGAPKFPSPHQLIFLLRYQNRLGEKENQDGAVSQEEREEKEERSQIENIANKNVKNDDNPLGEEFSAEGEAPITQKEARGTKNTGEEGQKTRASSTDSARAVQMVRETLRAMARGGIFDQLGFGLHRYSTDEQWLVPHFEKMLYDQALAASAYLEAFQSTGEQEFAGVAEKIFDYVLENLCSPEGAFYSAEDADTEGEEGAYYVWTTSEFKEILGEERGELAAAWFGVNKGGNFEGGRSVLHRPVGLEELSRHRGEDAAELKSTLEECRRELLKAREKRNRPFRDDKIITAWNGMMVAALARGSAALARSDYAVAAQKAADFILQNLVREGRLMRHYREGEAGVPAFLEDYAFLNWGLLELYLATLEKEHLHNAYRFTGEMTDLFLREDGTLGFVGKDKEEELSPLAEAYDGAHPSGVSVAAHVLFLLARTLRSVDLERKGRQILAAYREEIPRAPQGFTHLLSALDLAISPPEELVIIGDRDSKEVKEMIGAVFRAYRPHLSIIFRPRELPEDHLLRELAPFLKDMVPLKKEGKEATAYYCRGYQCLPPVTSPLELKKWLDGRRGDLSI